MNKSRDGVPIQIGDTVYEGLKEYIITDIGTGMWADQLHFKGTKYYSSCRCVYVNRVLAITEYISSKEEMMNSKLQEAKLYEKDLRTGIELLKETLTSKYPPIT